MQQSVPPVSHCSPLGCAGCAAGRSRREFIAAAGAAAAGIVAGPALLDGAPRQGKPRIRIVYALHAEQQDRPDWPNKDFDFRPAMARTTGELTRACPEFEFLTALAAGEEQARKIADQDKGADVAGYVVCQMNCWNRVVQTLAGTGKPVLYVDFQYGGSGGFLVYTATLLRAAAPNVAFVASSKIDDLVAAVKCFRLARPGAPRDFVAAVARERVSATPRPAASAPAVDALKPLAIADCLDWMKTTTILAVRGEQKGLPAEQMGIRVVHVPFAELNDSWKAADREQARAVADRWQESAAKIDGVNRETLEASAAMYLGMKNLLRARSAMAITVDCLGGFYGGHIHAYPCLGFHELNNEGLVGACECDVRSTATMVAGTILTQGRPGYISDPVIDTAKRQIVYAHCVASNRPFGQKGAVNAFEILTHSEDRQGASVRSILPVGYMTTTLEFEPSRKEVLFHRAVAVGNDPDDRACRTKLCAEPVGDIERLFTMWDRWGWHRVTFYGDLKEPVYALAAGLGYKVVEEA